MVDHIAARQNMNQDEALEALKKLVSATKSIMRQGERFLTAVDRMDISEFDPRIVATNAEAHASWLKAYSDEATKAAADLDHTGRVARLLREISR